MGEIWISLHAEPGMGQSEVGYTVSGEHTRFEDNMVNGIEQLWRVLGVIPQGIKTKGTCTPTRGWHSRIWTESYGQYSRQAR